MQSIARHDKHHPNRTQKTSDHLQGQGQGIHKASRSSKRQVSLFKRQDRQNEHKAQSTKHKAQSTKHKAQSTRTRHKAQSTKHKDKAQGTKHNAQGIKYAQSIRHVMNGLNQYLQNGNIGIKVLCLELNEVHSTLNQRQECHCH